MSVKVLIRNLRVCMSEGGWTVPKSRSFFGILSKNEADMKVKVSEVSLSKAVWSRSSSHSLRV